MKRSSIADRYLQTLESNSLENAPKSPPKSIHDSPSRSPKRALPTPIKATPGASETGGTSKQQASPLKPRAPASNTGAESLRGAETLRAKAESAKPLNETAKQPLEPQKQPHQQSKSAYLSKAPVSPTAKSSLPSSTSLAKIGPKPDRNPLMHNQDLSPSQISWDKERKNWQAYEYLCHVAEAKEWVEKLLGSEQPAVETFPESLQNGIALAKVTKKLRPDLLKWPIFEHKRLQYRHTENITMFFDLLEAFKIPSLFQFDMTDLYEKRNLPKVIYCIHAVSHYIADSGTDVAAVDDLVGKLEFSEDQLDTTQRTIAGKSMPNFGAMTRQLSGRQPKLDIESEPEAEPEPEPEPESDQNQGRKSTGSLDSDHEDPDADLAARLRNTKIRADSPYGSEDEQLDVKPRRRYRKQTEWEERVREFSNRVASYDRGDKYGYNRRDSYGDGYRYGESYRRTPRSRRDLDSRDHSQYAYSEWNRRHRDSYNPRNFSNESIRSRVLSSTELMLMQLEMLEPEIEQLQSRCRGALVRKQYRNEKAADIVGLVQALSRGFLVRNRISMIKHQPDLIQFQSAARGKLVRRHIGGAFDMPQEWAIRLQTASRGHLARLHHQAAKPRATEAQLKSMVELQAVARGVRVRKYFSATATQARQIVTVQSLARGKLTRRHLNAQKDLLESRDAAKSITALQSSFRGVVLRFRLGCLYDDLDQQILGIVGLQARLRGHLQKRKFEAIRSQWIANTDKIIQLQSIWRTKVQGGYYRTLIADANPTLNSIKPFVHLIDDNEEDYRQELELEQLGRRIGVKVKENDQLEGRIAQLDTKIALLVKNNISIDEVVLQQQRQNQDLRQQLHKESQLDQELNGSGSGRKRAHAAQASTASTSDNGNGLKLKFDPTTLQKSSRKRVELYQGLLYVLQTQPEYTSKMMKYKPPKPLDMAKLILSIFGQAEAPREQFFLLKLLGKTINQSSVGSPENMVAWKIVSHLNRTPDSIRQAKKFLAPAASKLSSSADQLLEYDPHIIYQHLTGGGDLSSEEAIQEPSVRAVFVQNLQRLRDIAYAVVQSLLNNFNQVPFHIKFLAREVYRQVLSATGEKQTALAAIGQVLMSQYLQPVFLSADSLEIVDAAIGHTAKNIMLVSKLLGQIGLMKPFDAAEGTDVYLQPLNEFVKNSALQLTMKYQDAIVDSPDLHSFFHMSEFDDITMHERPVLDIATNNVLAIHAMCYQHLSDFARSTDAMLRPVVEQLGPLPKDAREMYDLVRFQTLRLELNPRYGSASLSNSSANTSLLATTKRCLGYVLRVQSNADDLMAVLVAPVELEDEHKYNILLDTDNTRQVAGELSNLTFRELKLLTLEKVLELESAGVVSRKNAYQALVNAIAEDIRNKDKVRQQRVSTLIAKKRTLSGLEEKNTFLSERLGIYNNHIESALRTLQTETSLALQAKGKRFQRFQFSQALGHTSATNEGPSTKYGLYKTSAETLYERRVIVSMHGYTDRQLRDVSMIFSSNVVAEFQLDITYKGVLVPNGSTKVTLDELLDHQYQDNPTIDIAIGSVKFNTNRLLQLLFEKFFGAPAHAK